MSSERNVLKEEFEEYKKWRSGFEFSGNEYLLMYLFCLKQQERRRGLNNSCYEGNEAIVDEKIKEVLSNSSPPVQTSKSKILTSDKPKGFNMGLEVSATPTPKSPSATSPNPNIHRLRPNLKKCSRGNL